MKKWTLAALATTVLALSGCSLLGSGGTVEELQVTVGECVDEASVTEEGEQEIGVLPVVDCAEPHYAEVFHTVQLTDESFPADVVTQAEDACYGAFESYVGIDYAESIYYFTATYPTQGSWDNGDRQIACLLVGEVGEELTGSLKGAAE
ncbi:septum formation family protein [Demequina activiva]|uniref:Septum formation-related domain-containing protein n=1 Tax=Demequina activiva TaxID=1582364 RepID=A0A919Q0D1_9MICO|nr:septum formation family protein [Demequina activiva]GIG53985.1 hypothetical protein Dac01nite_07370 [Demequina activiva]